MKRIIVIISGVLLGVLFFTLAAYTRTFNLIELVHFSHFFLFYILGFFTAYLQNKGYTFSRYLFPISFSILYITIPLMGMENAWSWVMFLLDGSLMYLGYFSGYFIRKKILLIIFPFLITALILFVIKPIYVKNLYSYYYINNKGNPKQLNKKINIEGSIIQDRNKETINIKSYLEHKENIILFTFTGCKPCREKLSVIEKNIDIIAKKKSIIVIHDGSLDSFTLFEKEANHHKKLNTFYDSAGILSESIKNYSQKAYPIEFTVKKDLTIVNYVKGYDANVEDLYLKSLLQ